MLAKDYERLSRPVYRVVLDLLPLKKLEGGGVRAYLDFSAQHVVNEVAEPVEWSGFYAGATVNGTRMGTSAQCVLCEKGDKTNINWGYLYLAPVGSSGTKMHPLRHFILNSYQKRSFYQDRLGTKIGKALKKRCVFRRQRRRVTRRLRCRAARCVRRARLAPDRPGHEHAPLLRRRHARPQRRRRHGACRNTTQQHSSSSRGKCRGAALGVVRRCVR